MCQLRQRVGLIDHLRQLATTKEVIDRSRDALWINQRTRSHIVDFLLRHTILNGTTKLKEAFSQFVTGQFVNRSQTSITKVIDIIDVGIGTWR